LQDKTRGLLTFTKKKALRDANTARLVHFVSCQKVDNRAFVVRSVQFSAQSHKSV